MQKVWTILDSTKAVKMSPCTLANFDTKGTFLSFYPFLLCSWGQLYKSWAQRNLNPTVLGKNQIELHSWLHLTPAISDNHANSDNLQFWALKEWWEFPQCTRDPFPEVPPPSSAGICGVCVETHWLLRMRVITQLSTPASLRLFGFWCAGWKFNRLCQRKHFLALVVTVP